MTKLFLMNYYFWRPMPMSILKYILPFILLFTISCENDLDILDDYKETPVIYGLLNPTSTQQYIRLQKAYLGEGNALLMAQEPDSIYYDTNLVSLSLIQVRNGVTINTFELHPRMDLRKEEGLFTDLDHRVYFLDHRPDRTSQYHLKFLNKSTGLIATSVTDIITPPVQQTLSSAININLADDDPFRVRIRTGQNGRMYGLNIKFKYLERRVGQVVYTQKTIDIPQPYQLSFNDAGNEVMEFHIDGKNFYQILGSKIPVDPNMQRPAVSTRLDFQFTVGSEEFYTYYVVNQPNNAVFSSPDYTNIENGKGIFTSRMDTTLKDYNLNSASQDSLVHGFFTLGRFQ